MGVDLCNRSEGILARMASTYCFAPCSRTNHSWRGLNRRSSWNAGHRRAFDKRWGRRSFDVVRRGCRCSRTTTRRIRCPYLDRISLWKGGRGGLNAWWRRWSLLWVFVRTVSSEGRKAYDMWGSWIGRRRCQRLLFLLRGGPSILQFGCVHQSSLGFRINVFRAGCFLNPKVQADQRHRFQWLQCVVAITYPRRLTHHSTHSLPNYLSPFCQLTFCNHKTKSNNWRSCLHTTKVS
jgi:hypothetical protein